MMGVETAMLIYSLDSIEDVVLLMLRMWREACGVYNARVMWRNDQTRGSSICAETHFANGASQGCPKPSNQ
jgi:hypothetical protein